MINDDTLVMLNKLGIGLNIDLIELYVDTYRVAQPIASGGIDLHAHDAFKLRKALEELKPSSQVILSSGKAEVIKNNKVYSLTTNLDEPAKVIYGPADLEIQTKERDKFYITNSYKFTLCGCEILDGVNVLVIYKSGLLSKIYAISHDGIYYDFTDELHNSVPNELEDLKHIPVTELIGVAYQTGDKTLFNNVILDTVYDLRHVRNLDTMKITFNDIFTLTDDLELIIDHSTSNKFSKIEFMSGLGLSVVKAGILREVDKQNFNPAVAYFSEFFANKGIYRFSISDNVDYKTSDRMIIYDSKHVNSDYVFSGVVNGIEQFGDTTKLIIVNKICNDNLTISSVDLNDVYLLEKNNIRIGSKIEFRVINSRVVLV